MGAAWARLSRSTLSFFSPVQMIKIKQVQAQVRLLPLLSKDLELKHIGLIGVDVLLETDKTGRGNSDLSAEDSAAGKTGAFKFHNIDIDKISIEKLNLTFHDGETGSAKRLTLANLEGGQARNYRLPRARSES